MKIRNVTRPTERGADIHFLAGGKSPSWGIIRWDATAQTLAGYVGVPSDGGVDIVRPVKISRANLNDNDSGALALLGFLTAADISIENNSAAATPIASSIGAWEDFLGSGATSKSARAPQDSSLAQLDDAQIKWFVNNRLVREVGQGFEASRDAGISKGAPVSGFTAARLQGTMSKIFTEVKAPPELDLERARQALRGVAVPSSRAVSWYGAKSQTSLERSQAAASFPVLAGMIADNPIISRAVDNRESIQSLISDRTGLGKGALKRIGKISAPIPAGSVFEDGHAHGEDALGVNRMRRFSVSGTVSMDMMLSCLASLPPDRVPQDDKSWLIMHDILAGCAIPLFNAFDIPINDTLNASKGDWIGFHGILAKAADFSPERFDRRSIALTTIDAIQAIEDLGRSAILPLVLSSISGEEQTIPAPDATYFQGAMQSAGKIVLGQSKNIAATLFETARRYSSRIPALIEAAGFGDSDATNSAAGRFAEYGEEAFPLMINKPFTASNGLVIRQLSNFDEMREESKRLHHCVGRLYLNKARQMHCHIFSIQNASGDVSHSTLELSGLGSNATEEGVSQQYSVQHRGNHNQEPSASETAAVNEFVAGLKNGTIPVNLENISEWVDYLRENKEYNAATKQEVTPGSMWKGGLGTDWEDADRRHATWQEWRFIIGGRFGKAEDPGIIWAEKSARDLLFDMSPYTAEILQARAKEPKPSDNGPSPEM